MVILLGQIKNKGVKYSNCHGKHVKLKGKPVMNQTLIAGLL